MRTIFIILAIAAQLPATITNAQTPLIISTNCGSGSGTTPSITVPATVAGDAGVFFVLNNSNSITATAPTQAGTWTLGANFNTAGTLLGYYNLSMTAGVTSIGVTGLSTSGNARMCYYATWHTNLSGGTWTFVNGAGSSSTCTNCTGPSISGITGASAILEVISAGSPSASTCTAFTNNGTRGVSTCLNVSSDTMNWTNASATAAVGGIALKENAAGGSTRRRVSIIQAMLEDLWDLVCPVRRA